MGEARRRTARGDGSGPADLAGLLAQARLQHERRDFVACVRLCERVLAQESRHSDAHHLLGLAQLESGARELGIASLRHAVDLDPNAPGYRFNLGLALRAVGDLEGAALCFAWVCVTAPESNAAHYQYAVTLEALGNTQAAEAAFRKAIAAAPNHVLSHCGLARTAYERGAVAEAMAAQAWAVALDPAAGDEGRIGSARGEAGTAIALHAEHAAIEACRDSVAAGSDVHDVVSERELRVVDDFEADFEGWRAFALGCRYGAEPSRFPDEQTPAAYATVMQMQRIAAALGRDIKWRSPQSGAFRVSYAASAGRNDIHVDQAVDRPRYDGVLYLARPEDCRGGTTFWCHRASGWARVASDAVAREQGWRDFREFAQREMPDAAGAWERVCEVPMHANRLVLYRSDYFHAMSEPFGTRRDHARLVQLFHFEPL